MVRRDAAPINSMSQVSSDAAQRIASATIAQLKKEIKTVVARLKEQNSQMQRVKTHIEISKAVERTALNNP
jgi:gas vesicle protein